MVDTPDVVPDRGDRAETKLDGPAEVPDRRLTLAVAGASLATTNAVLALHDTPASPHREHMGGGRGGGGGEGQGLTSQETDWVDYLAGTAGEGLDPDSAYSNIINHWDSDIREAAGGDEQKYNQLLDALHQKVVGDDEQFEEDDDWGSLPSADPATADREWGSLPGGGYAHGGGPNAEPEFGDDETIEEQDPISAPPPVPHSSSVSLHDTPGSPHSEHMGVSQETPADPEWERQDEEGRRKREWVADVEGDPEFDPDYPFAGYNAMSLAMAEATLALADTALLLHDTPKSKHKEHARTGQGTARGRASQYRQNVREGRASAPRGLRGEIDQDKVFSIASGDDIAHLDIQSQAEAVAGELGIDPQSMKTEEIYQLLSRRANRREGAQQGARTRAQRELPPSQRRSPGYTHYD